MSTPATSDPKLALLRHAVATLAYRGGKPLRGSPGGENFVRADIVAGRVGPEQSPPALEFD